MRSIKLLLLCFCILLSVGYISADTNNTIIEFENAAPLTPLFCQETNAKASVSLAKLPHGGLNSNFGIIIDPMNSTGDILTTDNDNNNDNNNNNDFNAVGNNHTVVYYQNINININYNYNKNPTTKQNLSPKILKKLIAFIRKGLNV